LVIAIIAAAIYLNLDNLKDPIYNHQAYDLAMKKIDTLYELKTAAADQEITIEEWEVWSSRLRQEIDSLRTASGLDGQLNHEIRSRQKVWEDYVEDKIRGLK